MNDMIDDARELGLELLMTPRFTSLAVPDLRPDRAPVDAQSRQIERWLAAMKEGLLPTVRREPEPKPPGIVELDLVELDLAAGFDADERDIDYEDFHEDAARFLAALDTGLPLRLIDGNGDELGRFNGCGDVDGGRPALFLGVGTRSGFDRIADKFSLVEDPSVNDKLANRYWGFEAFRRAAGRHIEAVDNPVDGMPILDAILRMRDAGMKEVFIKGARPKSLITRIDATGTRQQILSRLLETIEYEFERQPEKDGFILQGVMEPRFEYRFVVIDQIPVTGAGVTAWATPLNSEDQWIGGAFCRKMTETPTGLHREERIAEYRTYMDFIPSVIHDLAQECPELKNYSLDVCIDAKDGKPKVIELNGILNLGLYACRPKSIVEARIAQATAVLQARQSPGLRLGAC